MSEQERPSVPNNVDRKPGRWSQLKELFRPHRPTEAHPVAPNLLVQPKGDYVNTQREKDIAGELHNLGAAGEPPQPTIPLEAINLYHELPINWDAITNLGLVANRLKETPVTKTDISRLKPPEAAYRGIPMVASVVAHAAESTIPLTLPTDADVRAIKPWLNDVSRVIGLFSEGLQNKFHRYIERRGGEIVTEVGLKIHDVAQIFAGIEHPQEQFRDEIYRLYANLQLPQHKPDDSFFAGFFGEEFVEVTPEEKIGDLLHAMRFYRNRGNLSDREGWFQNKNFPLLTKILPLIKFPPDSFDIETASVAGAEMMQGIEFFLRHEGFRNVQPAPGATEYDLLDLLSFNADAWKRTLAEWFKPGQLEEVRQKLPDILHYGKEALPKSGPQFAQKVYGLAKNIVFSKEQGRSDSEMAMHIFARK